MVNYAESLEDAIERLKDELTKLSTKYGGVLHPEVLRVSCLIDELIIKYYKQ
ncbi:aspartyl-phosphate phosphatase Spo0E family protein [Gordoniibacillus kamchatkensis]|uniref:aspartyl-phosphate phosphatase Spo0E family protein n=1 Tax=Gordoniibacillus kamchatkensis TaxID=1590651 RepID=UPI0009E52A8A|nr:aspartyl-phosphate phosphatase Spo0E family protein [Paenibacillus sp. VKM B-2647]